MVLLHFACIISMVIQLQSKKSLNDIGWCLKWKLGSKPRLVIGDFNDIKFAHEKEGGTYRSEASFYTFRRTLSICGLHDIKTYGGCSTWVGQKHSHTVRTRIDRAVATSDWLDLYPTTYVQVLPWQGSDRRALLLHLETGKWRGHMLFRYDIRWRFNEAVKDNLRQVWTEQCQVIPSNKFSKDLELCRRSLSRWKSQNATNSHKKIQELQASLQQAYEATPLAYNLILSIKSQLCHEYMTEEEYERTKVKFYGYKQEIKAQNIFMLKLI